MALTCPLTIVNKVYHEGKLLQEKYFILRQMKTELFLLLGTIPDASVLHQTKDEMVIFSRSTWRSQLKT